MQKDITKKLRDQTNCTIQWFQTKFNEIKLQIKIKCIHLKHQEQKCSKPDKRGNLEICSIYLVCGNITEVFQETHKGKYKCPTS